MDEKEDKRSRKWVIEINRPIEKGFTHEVIKDRLAQIKNLEYWCMCDEIGLKNKKYHTHIYLYRSTAIRWSKIEKLFKGGHWVIARGSSQQNRDYIRKEGKYLNTDKAETNLKDTFEEFGVMPNEQQGRRNDLHNLYSFIKDGMTDYEILEEDANYMTKLDTISRVRETLRYEEFSNRTREVTVEYWYGKTGTGKTSTILYRYGFNNVYVVDDFRHPWDGYKGQDVVLFDEFNASCYDISQLLRWLDRYPVQLPCRYNNKQACYTKVYFTSNRSFEEQYKFLRLENLDIFNALLRRFTCFKVFGENGNLEEYADYDSYISRWQPVTKLEAEMVFRQEKMDLEKGR